MQQSLTDLLRLLELERLEINLFRGTSRDIGSAQVFGGQVLGQALRAAYATVEGRKVHSLHAYFLRRGDFNAPIVYEVDRSRDGHSFSSRRVVAIQHGEQIFHMSASFQAPEDGLDHQLPMPDVPPPESLPDLRDVIEAQHAPLPAAVRAIHRSRLALRVSQRAAAGIPAAATRGRRAWTCGSATVDKLGDDDQQHRCLLAYVSDYYLIGTAMRPHGYTMASPGIVVASIDHAMWFHRPMRVDDWLLYSIESPSASGARGFARASLFARDGRLVASTAQEGLLRVMPAGERRPASRLFLGLLDHLEVIAGRIDAHADQDAGLAELEGFALHLAAGCLDRRHRGGHVRHVEDHVRQFILHVVGGALHDDQVAVGVGLGRLDGGAEIQHELQHRGLLDALHFLHAEGCLVEIRDCGRVLGPDAHAVERDAGRGATRTASMATAAARSLNVRFIRPPVVICDSAW